MVQIDVSFLDSGSMKKRYYMTNAEVMIINHLELLAVKFICACTKIYVCIIILKCEESLKSNINFYTSLKISSINEII